MIRIRTLGWTVLPLAFVACFASAQEAPDAVVKRVAEDIMAQVRADKELQSGNLAKAKQVLETKLVPNFDFPRMTALAMGRNWRTATPEQQKQLTDEFRPFWCARIRARWPITATTRWTTSRCA